MHSYECKTLNFFKSWGTVLAIINTFKNPSDFKNAVKNFLNAFTFAVTSKIDLNGTFGRFLSICFFRK